MLVLAVVGPSQFDRVVSLAVGPCSGPGTATVLANNTIR